MGIVFTWILLILSLSGAVGFNSDDLVTSIWGDQTEFYYNDLDDEYKQLAPSNVNNDAIKTYYEGFRDINHPANPCYRMRKAWENMPYDFPPSDRELVIGAGEGATGTTWLSQRVRNLGYNVAHWGLSTGDDLASHSWMKLKRFLLDQDPVDREHYNFDVISNRLHGIFDTPVQNLFPYLFKAYPKAKVILTIQQPAKWIKARTYKGYDQSIPSIYHRKPLLKEMRDPPAMTQNNRPQATMLVYEQFNTLVRCIVPKEQLLEVNVVEDGDTLVKQKLQAFLGLGPTKG